MIPAFLPKDHLLLEPPRVSEHLYFLVDGFAMSYTFSREEKRIEWFWKPNQVIMSPRSMFEKVPSKEFIQLTTISEVLCISYSNLNGIIEKFPETNLVYRVIMNKYYEHCRERLRDMQQLSAAMRFEKLLKYYPGIEQMISQESIASYLGITPQSLSRIKRRQ